MNRDHSAGLIVLFSVIIMGAVALGGGAAGDDSVRDQPEVDLEISSSGDDCRLSGTVDPGAADRVVVDSGRSEYVLDRRTVIGMTVTEGSTVEVYAIRFEGDADGGEVEMLIEGFVTDRCEFDEVPS